MCISLLCSNSILSVYNDIIKTLVSITNNSACFLLLFITVNVLWLYLVCIYIRFSKCFNICSIQYQEGGVMWSIAMLSFQMVVRYSSHINNMCPGTWEGFLIYIYMIFFYFAFISMKFEVLLT